MSQMPTMFTAGLAKYDPFWATNDCEVSKLRYLPIMADFKLTASMRLKDQDIAFWIRVDFIKPNKVLPQSGSHALNLPEGLFSMAHLLQDLNSPMPVNDINPAYMYSWTKCAKSQWIKMQATPGMTENRTIIRHKTFRIKFPKKVINVETDTPYSYANDSILTNIPRKMARTRCGRSSPSTANTRLRTNSRSDSHVLSTSATSTAPPTKANPPPTGLRIRPPHAGPQARKRSRKTSSRQLTQPATPGRRFSREAPFLAAGRLRGYRVITYASEFF